MRLAARLRPLLRNRDPAVRCAAVIRLGWNALALVNDEIFDAYIDVFQDPDERVAWAALRVYWVQIHPSRMIHEQRLEKELRGAIRLVRATSTDIAQAAKRFVASRYRTVRGPVQSSAEPAVEEMLSDADPEIRLAAAEALISTRAADVALMEAAMSAATHPEPHVRSRCARVLATMRSAIPAAGATLRRLLTDPEASVRHAASLAMVSCGYACDAALVISELYRNRDSGLAGEPPDLTELVARVPDPAALVPMLASAVRLGSPSALRHLAAIDQQALSVALEDQRRTQQHLAALGQLAMAKGDCAADAIKALVIAAADQDERFRRQALESLRSLLRSVKPFSRPDAVPRLHAILDVLTNSQLTRAALDDIPWQHFPRRFDRDAIRALVRTLGMPDIHQADRHTICIRLSECNEQADFTVQQLSPMLTSPTTMSAAADALVHIGTERAGRALHDWAVGTLRPTGVVADAIRLLGADVQTAFPRSRPKEVSGPELLAEALLGQASTSAAELLVRAVEARPDSVLWPPARDRFCMIARSQRAVDGMLAEIRRHQDVHPKMVEPILSVVLPPDDE